MTSMTADMEERALPVRLVCGDELGLIKGENNRPGDYLRPEAIMVLFEVSP